MFSPPSPPPFPTFFRPPTPPLLRLGTTLEALSNLEDQLTNSNATDIDYNRMLEQIIASLVEAKTEFSRESIYFGPIMNQIGALVNKYGIQQPIIMDIRPMLSILGFENYPPLDILIRTEFTAVLFYLLGTFGRCMPRENLEMIDMEGLWSSIEVCDMVVPTLSHGCPWKIPIIIWGFARLLCLPIIGDKLKERWKRKTPNNMLNTAKKCIERSRCSQEDITTAMVGLVLLELVGPEFIPYGFFCPPMEERLMFYCNTPNHLDIFDALAEYYRLKMRPTPVGMPREDGLTANMRESIRKIENFEIYESEEEEKF